MMINGLRILLSMILVGISYSSQSRETGVTMLLWFAESDRSELSMKCPASPGTCWFELSLTGIGCKESGEYDFPLVSDKKEEMIRATCQDAGGIFILEPYDLIESLVRRANHARIKIPLNGGETHSVTFRLPGHSAVINAIHEYRTHPYCKTLPDQELGLFESYGENFTFSNLYPTPFHETNEFSYLLIGGSMAAAATITYATAGAGAPAVIPGTSALIVAVGGGSQGAYMAGLSTIGSLVGSNAIGGAAILNGLGIAVGLSATAKNAAVFGVALKSMTGIILAGYDGILIAESKDTGKLVLVSELRMPENIKGSDHVRSLAESTRKHEEEVAEASDETDLLSVRRYYNYRKADLTHAVELLECIFLKQELGASKVTPEDIILLSIMAHKTGDFDAFHRAVKMLEKFRKDSGKQTSFIDYLIANSYFMQGDIEEGAKYLQYSIDAEPGIPEPTTLQLVYFSRDRNAFERNEFKMDTLIETLEQNFDEDDYKSPYSKASVYFRLGKIYLQYDRPVKARDYFEKALENLNLIQKSEIFSSVVEQKFKHEINVNLAISYARVGKVKAAEAIMQDLVNSFKEDDERRLIYRKTYDGSI